MKFSNDLLLLIVFAVCGLVNNNNNNDNNNNNNHNNNNNNNTLRHHNKKKQGWKHALNFKKIVPRMGPIIGDTSIAATIKTVALVARPPAAIIEAPIRFNQVLIVIFALFEISANNSSVVLLAFC